MDSIVHNVIVENTWQLVYTISLWPIFDEKSTKSLYNMNNKNMGQGQFNKWKWRGGCSKLGYISDIFTTQPL
jgi:hypothetical protein